MGTDTNAIATRFNPYLDFVIFIPVYVHMCAVHVLRVCSIRVLYCTLQSVQAAVDHQLGEFAKSQPNAKISLVTFNNEVTVFGDGKNDAVVVTGDKLNDNDALVKVGTEASLPANIKETRESLSSKLFRYHLYTHYTYD